MFVHTSISALYSVFYLDGTERRLGGTLEQLSTGRRINSSADDPAGMAIAASMANQIGGMTQAWADVQEGISLLQTADGGLSQVEHLLQSMIALATEAANGTNDAADRAAIQQQIDQYTQAIAAVANQTDFNTKNLLAGVLGQAAIPIGPDPAQALRLSLGAVDPVSLGIAGALPLSAAFTSATAAAGSLSGLTVYGPEAPQRPNASRNLLGSAYSIAVTAEDATLNGQDINGAGLTPAASTAAGTQGGVAPGFVLYDGAAPALISLRVVTGSASGVIGSVSYSLDSGQTFSPATVDANGDYALGGTGTTLLAAGLTTNATPGATDTYSLTLAPAAARFTLLNNAGQTVGSASSVSGISGSDQTVTVGDLSTGEAVGVAYNAAALFGVTPADLSLTNGVAPSSPMADAFTIQYASAGQAASGAGGTLAAPAQATAGLSVMSYASAESALRAFQTALTRVSAERARVGASTDRLDKAGTDLTTSASNLRQALGDVRDTDLALAAAQLARDMILQNAGVAMVSVADAIPRALLSLLHAPSAASPAGAKSVLNPRAPATWTSGQAK